LGKSLEVMPALRQALQLSDKRLRLDAKAHDLRAGVLQDPRFASLRRLPEFKQLTAPP
jgi:hypothetical protein